MNIYYVRYKTISTYGRMYKGSGLIVQAKSEKEALRQCEAEIAKRDWDYVKAYKAELLKLKDNRREIMTVLT